MGNSNAVLSDDEGSGSGSGSLRLYQIGEKVLALHSQQFWEAKVTDVRSGNNIREYLVHYSNGSEGWDEWLGVEYLKKYNDDNEQHFICKEPSLKNDEKAAQASKFERKKMRKKAKYSKKLTKRLQGEEKKAKELKMLLNTLSTQLPKPTAASAILVEAADQPPTLLQQVPTREVVDIREQEQVSIGTPRKPNERPSVELVPDEVTARAAELSMSWVSLFGPNVDLSHPSVQADLLHLIGLPKEMAEQQQKTHEEVLLSSVHHSLRSLLRLNALISHVKELSAISNNYRKEKEEMEKKLNEKSSVVDKLTEHFTRQFRKLLSERKAAEETLEKKEKEWEAQEAELKKQLDEFKAETASLRNSLDEVKTNQANLLKRIKEQYPDLDEEEYVVVKDL